MAVVGVQRMCLKQLHTKITNSLIVGVIIAKQKHRIFADKNGGDRGVWNFTLRDSVADYVNITCWGSAAYVIHLDQTFCVGFVVDVINPKIAVRHIDDTSEQFRPAVTSPFNLTLNESFSSIQVHAGDNYSEYLRLLSIPTKPLTGLLTLADVNSNRAMCGELVDVMVVVKKLKPVRKVLIKKDGNEKGIRDVVVMDKTWSEMSVTLWDSDLIQRSSNWKGGHTVLFLADMKVEWSAFWSAMTIAFTSRSILTENPEISAAHDLREFAAKAPLTVKDYLDVMACKFQDPFASKSRTMSCDHILHVAEINTESVDTTVDQHFTAVVYAFVKHLDLDGYTKITTTICGRCNYEISNSERRCLNVDCPVSLGKEPESYETYFDFKVILTDHTGSLENCRVMGRTAEYILGVTINQFENMTDEGKEMLKWKFLLRRCAAHVLVFKTAKDCIPFVSILSLNIPDSEEVFHNLPFN